MRICEINFGVEIGTRPAVIVRGANDRLEVMKITTKSRATDYGKYRLSGLSGVRGYVVTNAIYTVPKSKVKRYTGTLFECESKGALNKMNMFSRQGKLDKIIIG